MSIEARYSAIKSYILSGIGTVRCPCTVLGVLTKAAVSVKANAFREMVKKYCTFVNIKLDEALDGKSAMSYADKTELKIT